MDGLTEDEVRSRVRDAVRDFAPNPEQWTLDSCRLSEDLEYHSLALLELAFVLEDEFGLPPLVESNVVGIRTVKDVEDFVLANIDNGAPEASA